MVTAAVVNDLFVHVDGHVFRAAPEVPNDLWLPGVGNIVDVYVSGIRREGEVTRGSHIENPRASFGDFSDDFHVAWIARIDHQHPVFALSHSQEYVIVLGRNAVWISVRRGYSFYE